MEKAVLAGFPVIGEKHLRVWVKLSDQSGGIINVFYRKHQHILTSGTLLLVLFLFFALHGEARTYKLGVGDVLRISVWGHSELNSEVEIRPDGFITFPLVGDVHATSRSPEELAQLIQDGLAEYVIEPKVTVMVVQFRTIGVQVLGKLVHQVLPSKSRCAGNGCNWFGGWTDSIS